MTIEQYLKDRWNSLTPEAKRILGLTDAEGIAFTQMMWEMQYNREQLSQMQAEIDELRRMVKRLYPEK
jgi:hypothetical protein